MEGSLATHFWAHGHRTVADVDADAPASPRANTVKAREAVHPLGKWLPIDSAPRHGFVTIGEAGRLDSVRTCEWWPSRQRWVLATLPGGDPVYFRGFPTHWLRTPSVPLGASTPA